MHNKDEVKINDILYKRYIENYYITRDGVLSKIEYDGEDNICFYRVLRQETCKYGHKRVEIKINKKPVKVLIHRAVYQTWIGELLHGMVIEHLDGNPANNRCDNLKQSTQKENIHTAIKHGTFNQRYNNRTNVVVYDKWLDETKEYESVKDFLIDIKCPDYIVRHGSLSGLNKRIEWKERYVVEKIGVKGRSSQTNENIA